MGDTFKELEMSNQKKRAISTLDSIKVGNIGLKTSFSNIIDNNKLQKKTNFVIPDTNQIDIHQINDDSYKQNRRFKFS